MKLKNIQIKNYKCLVDASLEIRDLMAVTKLG